MTDALALIMEPDVDPALLPTRVQVVSDLPGMAEMVARNVARGDTGLVVRHARLSLAALADKGPLEDTDLVIFGIRPGIDADVAALRALRATYGDAIKFLGLTSEPLSLAVARGLMEAGLDEVMPLAAAAPRLEDAAQMAPVAEETAQRRGQGQRDALVVAVAGARGGLGVTSFALNLAAMMIRQDKAARKAGRPVPRVAVVDLDFQNGVLGASIDAADGGGYLEMLQSGQQPDHDMIGRLMIAHPLGFDVMAAPDAVAPLDAMSPDMVAVLLDELRLAYDVVILDLPRALTDWTAPVLARADRLFLLADTSVHVVRQARRMLDLYRDDNATLPVEVVVAKEKKPFKAPVHVREAEKFLGEALRHWIPRDDRAARRAAGLGQPVAIAAPRSPIAKAMAAIVTDLHRAAADSQRRRA